MHELSLSTAVVETALRHAGGRRVRLVRLQVGALRQVVPASLTFYFDIVSRDTLCEGAGLEQQWIPARLRCGACRREWSPEEPRFRCPDCGGGAVEVLAGEEFAVDSIEVEGDTAERREEGTCTTSR